MHGYIVGDPIPDRGAGNARGLVQGKQTADAHVAAQCLEPAGADAGQQRFPDLPGFVVAAQHALGRLADLRQNGRLVDPDDLPSRRTQRPPIITWLTAVVVEPNTTW